MSAASSPESTVKFIVGGWVRVRASTRMLDLIAFLQLLGTFGDLVLQGILLGQFTGYFSLYKRDTTVLRTFALVLLLATTLKSVQVVYARPLFRARRDF